MPGGDGGRDEMDERSFVDTWEPKSKPLGSGVTGRTDGGRGGGTEFSGRLKFLERVVENVM